MSFRHQITTDDYDAGQVGYVQLITSGDIITDTYLKSFTATVNGLDGALGEFARGTPPVPASSTTPVRFYDGPCVPLATFTDNPTSESIYFSTYLMFNPNTSGSIWVPLRLINWQLEDEATHNSDNTWNHYDYNDSTGTAIYATPPSDHETTDFPSWTITY
jgi:hypothetical protein